MTDVPQSEAPLPIETRSTDACVVCGSVSRPIAARVLWPALIAEWELSDPEAASMDRREGSSVLTAVPHFARQRLQQRSSSTLAGGERSMLGRHRGLRCQSSRSIEPDS
jgi:hypothetical protein